MSKKSLSLAKLTKSVDKTPISIPADEIELGAVIYVMYPEPDDRDLLELQWTNYKKAFGIEGTVGWRKFIFTWALCDEDNTRLVPSGTEENRVTPEFIKTMNTISIPLRVIARAYDKAAHIFGFSETDIEELVKNSKATSSDDGSGGKPKQSDSVAKSGSKASKTAKK